MPVETCEVVTPTLVWSPAETLSPRVRRLRDQYWSFCSFPLLRRPDEKLP